MTMKNPLFKLSPQDFYSIYNALRSSFTTDDFIKTARHVRAIDVTNGDVSVYLAGLGFEPLGLESPYYDKKSVVCRNSAQYFVKRKSKFAKLL